MALSSHIPITFISSRCTRTSRAPQRALNSARPHLGLGCMGFCLALGRTSESWGTRGRPLKLQTLHFPKDRSHMSTSRDTQTAQTPEITELSRRLTASIIRQGFLAKAGHGRVAKEAGALHSRSSGLSGGLSWSPHLCALTAQQPY